MPKTICIFINGILARPGAHDGWTDRAVTWTHLHTPYRAEKWEYAAGPLSRRLRQNARARKVATMIGYYQRAGYDRVILVGHSNGCDVIARVLHLRGHLGRYYRPIHAAHLFAPAADAPDFERALQREDLQQLYLYCAGRDRALWWGAWTRRLFGWVGLGYGTLGRQPDVPLTYDPAVVVVEEPDYGHSSFFDRGDRFDRTMAFLHAQHAAEHTTTVKVPDLSHPSDLSNPQNPKS